MEQQTTSILHSQQWLKVTYADVQKEVADKKGFGVKEAQNLNDVLLQDDLIKIMPVGTCFLISAIWINYKCGDKSEV